MSHAFCDADRRAVYQAITTRRDARSQFPSQPLPEALLARLLMAAHHAPSVVFMQPWNFLVVRFNAVKQKVANTLHQQTEEADNQVEMSGDNTISALQSRKTLIYDTLRNDCINNTMQSLRSNYGEILNVINHCP